MRLGKLLLGLAAVWTTILFASPAKPAAVPMATEDRFDLPGWWPTKGTASRKEFIGPDACAECHASKVRTQKQTPMAHAALRPIDTAPLRKHDLLTFSLPPYTYQIQREPEGSLYSVTDGKDTISAALSWAFGLGEAGQTYIFERNGTFFESRMSYFPALDGLDFTPTPSRVPDSTLEEALGRRMLYQGETQRCFACHTTASTTNRRFDPNHLFPGVTCEACHGPGARHVAAIKADKVKLGLKSILDPGQLNPVDQVDFCGACHRTYVDVVLSKSRGILNLRFQPYRLERSQCWIKSNNGITCLSCHNPHQPRVRDLASYDDRCLSCHQHPHSKTSTSEVAAKNCVSCHMPKYEVPGMHAKFTDHYIRVIRKGEGYID
ncbi:MAG: multiheme c-type cytochrome [Terriglobales bacterium]